MSSFLEMEVLPEVDDCLKLRITAATHGFSGKADCYVNESKFLSFANDLQCFPKALDQIISFHSGSSELLSNFELNFSCANSSGHVKIEIEITHIESSVNTKAKPFSSCFSFIVMPAEIDLFNNYLSSVINVNNVGKKAVLRSET